MKRIELKKIIWTAAALLVLAYPALQAQNGGFRFRGLLSRVISPRNNGLNQLAIFCLDNPSGSGVDGQIYDLYGAHVADLNSAQSAALTACPQDSVVPSGPQYMTWDGRSNGMLVPGGVYIYRIRAESLTFTGSLLVVR